MTQRSRVIRPVRWEKKNLPREHAHLIPKCESNSDFPDSLKDEDGDKKGEDDKASQLEETGSVKVTRLQEKQALLKQKCKSDSEIPDSNKDVDKEKKVEDDEAKKVEGMKSVELAKLPRKQGNTEAEDDKARSQPSGKKEREESTGENLVLEANKQMAMKPFNMFGISIPVAMIT